MRGHESNQSSMLCLLSPSDRVPSDHPLRGIKQLADEALARLSPVFDEMYSEVGRPSIPPETLLKSTLLMALHSIRSERQLCEQLEYNLLFRWFLDLDMLDPIFVPTVFSKNRDRLMEHQVATLFLFEVVEMAKEAGLVSCEHFTVDGTLIEAWASLKSFRPRNEKPEDREPPDDPGNPTVNFHGKKRKNATHASTTDPEAKLARKGPGKEAKLSFHGHALMENKTGLLVDIRVTEANGRCEREAALKMLEVVDRNARATVGADKGYDVASFVVGCREIGITPHIAAKKKHSALDGRTTRHSGYVVSQRKRKLVEEIFGWLKTIGGMAKSRHRGVARTELAATIAGVAYNLVRMSRLGVVVR